MKEQKSELTNEQFRKQDEAFKVACELAKCEPSKRQASKWRRKLGKATKLRMKAAEVMRQREIGRLWREEGETSSAGS